MNYKQVKKSSGRYWLWIILTIFIQEIKAQVSTYSFSSSLQTYTGLSNGINLGDNMTEDQFFVDLTNQFGDTLQSGTGLPIGFTFYYNGIGMNVFGISANGWIALGSSSVNMNSASLYYPLSSATGGNFIAVCARNLQAQPGSELLYFTSGTSPARTLTVEWKNYRKHSNVGDSFNFQIQLHESDNSIEFHYGSFTHNINASFASVGLIGQDSSDFSVRSTTGSGGWANTTTGSLNSATCTLNPSTLPSDGLVFRWAAPLPCSAPPSPGISNSSLMTVCPNTPFSLFLSGHSTGPGQTYQWQSSEDSIIWQNINGAQTTSYSTTQSVSSWYRCEVTCSGQSGFSTPVKVLYNPPNLCYCILNLGGQCSSYGYIDNVEIASTTLHNLGTGCAGLTDIYYSDYPQDSNTTATLLGGTTYALSVTCSFNANVSLWIDYDQSGSFDANEWSQVSDSTVTNVASSILFTVPTNALAGITKMRLRCRLSGTTNGPIDACTNFLSGETEDYTLTINQPVGTFQIELSENQMMIYPNPVKGSMHIYFSEKAKNGTITILSTDGKNILQKNVSQSFEIEINLTSLATGIYVVQFESEIGRSFRRFVLKN